MPENLNSPAERDKTLSTESVWEGRSASRWPARCTRLVALIALLFAVAASDAPAPEAGVAAANAWLKLVDQGKYGRSWQDASSFFRSQITQDRWESRIDEVRAPLGPLVSRTLSITEPTTTLPGSPDGHYLVLQYQSSFAHKRTAIETVIMMLDQDDRYHTAGYFIR